MLWGERWLGVRGGMVPVNWHPPGPRFFGEIQLKAVRRHVGWYSHPTDTGSGFMDELERAAAVLAVYIDDFAEDDVEQREPGKALNSLDDQSEAFEQPNGKKVSNSGDAAPG